MIKGTNYREAKEEGPWAFNICAPVGGDINVCSHQPAKQAQRKKKKRHATAEVRRFPTFQHEAKEWGCSSPMAAPK